MNNPISFIDPNGATVESALGLIATHKKNIFNASRYTDGAVSPMLIARVVFQENMNDMVWMRNNDFTAVSPIGMAELKNIVGSARIALGVGPQNPSLGIGEMQINVAAKLLGYDPSNLDQDTKKEIAAMLHDPSSALVLVALHLQALQGQFEGASDTRILNAYNTGSVTGELGNVARRSGRNIDKITDIMGNADTEVIRDEEKGFVFAN